MYTQQFALSPLECVKGSWQSGVVFLHHIDLENLDQITSIQIVDL
jgi:hypothetical protein